MKKIHKVENIRFSGSQMKIRVDGREKNVNLTKVSRKLLKASIKEKECYEISPSGYGIYWSMIDEDLSVDSLIGIKHRISSKMLSKK